MMTDPAERGVALIFTLMLVVILSALILAFLITMRADRQQTFSYGNAIKANEMALGGLQQITGNLQAELYVGSTAATVSGVTLLLPGDNARVAPQRAGFNPEDYGADADGEKLPPTLLQVSRHDGASAVSDVSTAAPSANGRVVSTARWNAPLLLSGSQSKVPAAFVEQPPQWIYLTRAGSRRCEDAEALDGSLSAASVSNTSAVLGRYAYVIYDEGALLDINHAGSPAATVSGTDFQRKSFLAYADLTRLPGLKQDDVDALVNWRNRGGLAVSGGNYPRLLRLSATTGRLCAYPGDNPLLDRQDLIRYFSQVIGNTGALPHLGTFSRAVSAPSWSPRHNAADLATVSAAVAEATYYGGAVPSFAYRDLANNRTSARNIANPNLANARFITSGSVTHYGDDGAASGYRVADGEPLLQSRFSLARLEWLKVDPANPRALADSGKAVAIRECFGLEWGVWGNANGRQPCWRYAGGVIKTLEEVAAEGREPNFFELLKAAILHGSLGKSPGAASLDNMRKTSKMQETTQPQYNLGPNGRYAHTYNPDPASLPPVPARVPDMQIIRIGANIIDQYDADDYPTAVYFPYPSVAGTDFDPASDDYLPLTGPGCVAYGTENLPCLAQVNTILCNPVLRSTDPDLPVDTFTCLSGWLQPVVWNPHEEPAAVPAHRLQVRAYGAVQMQWSAGVPKRPADGYYDYSLSPVRRFFQTANPAENCPGGIINFTNSGTMYVNPVALNTDIGATSPYRNVTENPGGAGNLAQSFYSGYDTTYNSTRNRFAAFYAGHFIEREEDERDKYYRVYMPKPTPPDGTTQVYFLPADTTGAGAAMTFVLGWLDGADNFHPYSFLAGAYASNYCLVSNMRGKVHPAGNHWVYPDPRTDRFSFCIKTFSGELVSVTLRPKSSSGFECRHIPKENNFVWAGADTFGPPAVWMQNTAAPDTGAIPFAASSYYPDPDGVVRPGDGIYGNAATGDGLMLFQTKGTGPLPDDNTVTKHSRRPVILNRPFLSVGELGYVFRDQPFKTLDFFTPLSADAALLDVFTLADETRVSGGRLSAITTGQFNPNHAPVPVLEAVLAGAVKKERATASSLSDRESAALAAFIAGRLAGSPLANRADLVLRLGGGITAGAADGYRSVLAPDGKTISKTVLETPVRALASVTDTRVWNVMIDLIAQSGRLSPSAAKLADFIVEGERRYWLHLAIDRYTGRVIDQQLEPVYE